MGENYDYISDINARKLCWNFKVYVIRIWEHPSKFNEKEVGSIEMILQDSKGGRGHASISKTEVNHIMNPTFPLDAFVFKTIPELLTAEKIENSELFGQTSVQIHFEISKLHINAELKDVLGFRDMLLKGAPSNASRISQMSSQSGWFGVEEITNGSALVKTIEEALSSKEYYKAYRRCPKKVETPVGNRYECDKCGHTHGIASIRYKVEVMINVKVANISGYDQVFTVMKICDDEEVVDKNLPKNFDGNSSMNMTENGCNNSLDMFGNITDLNTDTDPDAQYTMDVREDSITSLKSKTPAKRVTNGFRSGSSSVIQNEDEGQLSTNKFSRKDAEKQKSIMIDGEN
ncbi:hypothetical protein AHAS_Ahas03G0157300 [Arachis hypogaea]